NASSRRHLVGGAGGTDTLQGDNPGDTFTVTRAGAGTSPGTYATPFRSIANLTGGTANDSFVFQNAGSITGNVVGGGGTDTVQGDNLGDTFTITGAGAATMSATIGGTISGIANITAGTANDTSLFPTAPT